MTPHTRHHRGFTLIELMVTMAVLGIILGIAAPNIQHFIVDNRTTTQTNDLIALLNLARSQAIQEGHRTQLCISHDQNNCVNGDWGDGWLVWVDRNDNDTLDGDEIARVGGAISLHTTTSALNSSDTPFTTVSFQPSGFAELGGGIAFAAINLEPHLCSGQQGRRITINASGSIRSERIGCVG